MVDCINKPWTSLGYTTLLLALIQTQATIHTNGGSCSVLNLLPFSSPPETSRNGVSQDLLDRYNRWSSEATSRVSFDYLATSQMAMDHFNERNPAVVPELLGLEGCTVYFSEQRVFDSQMEGSVSVKALWDATTSSLATSPDTDTISNDDTPCAILGPIDNNAAMQLQAVTAALGIPQLVYASENDELFHQDSSTVGTVLTTASRAQAMAEYLQLPHLKRDFLAIIQGSSEDNSPLAFELQELAMDYGMHVLHLSEGHPMRDVSLQEQIWKVLTELKMSGIKTVVFDVSKPWELFLLAETLESLDMMTDDYLFILSPESVPSDSINDIFGEVEVNSPLDKMLTGALVFDRLDLYRVNKDDAFLRAWQDEDAAFVERIKEMIPKQSDGSTHFQAQPDYFRDSVPANYASYLYDTIMMLGMGACHQQMGAAAFNDHPANNTTSTPLTRVDGLVKGMTGSSFVGASGRIRFEDGAKLRHQNDIVFGAYNILPVSVEGNPHIRTYKAVLTSMRYGEEGWQTIDGVSFVYRSGMTSPPLGIRTAADANYLSGWVRIMGLSLMGFTWFFSLTCMILIWVLRTTPTLQMSQPFFLHLLCIGAIIMSTSIFTLSWDEGAGWSDQYLDFACTATPWFFFSGQIITFSALFTKLWRVDRVLQFRRRKVQVRNVMGPLIGLLTMTVIILIVWTVFDPLTWERQWISENPGETYGECSSDYLLGFVSPLVTILILAEGLTVYYAWKTADVPEHFRDSSTIMYAICTHLQAWMVGVPTLAVLGNSSADATYVGRVLLVWIFSVSSVAFVVGIRLIRAIRVLHNPDLLYTTPRVPTRVSGLYLPRKATVVTPDPESAEAFVARRHATLASTVETASLRFGSSDEANILEGGVGGSRRPSMAYVARSPPPETIKDVSEEVSETCVDFEGSSGVDLDLLKALDDSSELDTKSISFS